MNVKVGTQGSPDERAFDSFKQALTDPDNNQYNFRRSDAFLAVVIVSDEDDFSRNDANENQCDPSSPPVAASCNNLRTVASFESFLDTYTSSPVGDRKYNVNVIAVRPGDSCAPNLNHFGVRYLQLANDTDGVNGSICDANFSATLNNIAIQVGELSTQFRLSQIPDVTTIVVKVNHILISEDAINGWTYNEVNNSIRFHGSALPPQGAAISVNFTPLNLH
jgi:hypothetical protein